MKLNEKQSKAVELVDKGSNLYISGPGGMGKSFLLNFFRERDKESAVFIAPTGISALNIRCSTAHSTFKLVPKIFSDHDGKHPNPSVYDLFNKSGPVKRIYLDEISMYRADLFKTIDRTLKTVRGNKLPFGGLQIIAVGDFYQLCPVLTRNEEEAYSKIHGSELYCFETRAWSSAKFEHIELTEPMRHSEETMVENLQNVRMRNGNWKESINFFNSLGEQNLEKVFEEDGIFLCTVNRSANTINEHNYAMLEGTEYSFRASKTGKFDAEPAPNLLKVKRGTKLLCVANDGELRNGMIVYFDRMSGDGKMIVETEDGLVIHSGKYKWKSFDYTVVDGALKNEVVGQYTQFPFKLGYAITVHKSQGCTLNSAIIERSSGFFSHGQAYVALSRIRKLEGVGITKPLTEKDIIVDPRVVEFYENDCRGIGLF